MRELFAAIAAVADGGDRVAVLAAANRVGGELNAMMGIRIEEFGPDRVAASMPVVGNRQPFGLLHGGANGVLAEALGSFHAALLAGPGRVAVGVELSCTHHRSMTAGSVTGVSTPVHVGRTMMTFDIVISREDGARVCTARLSCLVRGG
ncbi:hotdog fold thioesterase [Nakamurella lactea]|uniref:hotdog fold thioesterase n=1 Tax=Nakamurella lactea TaxID=459515 RepID=UPI0006889A4C